MSPMPEGAPMTVVDAMNRAIDSLEPATVTFQCQECGHSITARVLDLAEYDQAVRKHEATHGPARVFELWFSIDEWLDEPVMIHRGDRDHLMTVVSRMGSVMPLPGTDGAEWAWRRVHTSGTARLVEVTS